MSEDKGMTSKPTQGKDRCGQWDGQQCKATKDLTNCVVTIIQGTYLTTPDKVVVPLCPKHFQLHIPRRLA